MLQGNHAVHILLIENVPENISSIKNILHRSNIACSIQVIEDGMEALVCLYQHGKYRYALTPDIIFLSMDVPRMSGNVLLEKIKSDSTLKSIPVVVLAKSEMEREILEEFNVFVKNTISFPFNTAEILKTMSILIPLGKLHLIN